MLITPIGGEPHPARTTEQIVQADERPPTIGAGRSKRVF